MPTVLRATSRIPPGSHPGSHPDRAPVALRRDRCDVRAAPSTVEGIGTSSAIRLVEVTKRFPGNDTDAVTRLSLDVPTGSVVTLVGPSGCGKTTTLRMINRLVEPTSGRIEVTGTDVTRMPVTELRRGIGYVIQQVGLFPHRTVAQNIGTVPRTLRWDRRRIAERVDELVDLVGLDRELLGRYPDELSGGQQQRVGVARALAADPPVLLMDEPFGAVDPIVRAHLQHELLDLQQRLRKTIVLVTHDIDEAIRLGDRIAVFREGGILEQYAEPDEVLRRPASAFVERFVGEDRGIKRLELRTVADLPVEQGPVVDVGASAEHARKVLATTRSRWLGLLRDGVFLGWVSAEAVVGDVDLASLDAVPPAAQLSPSSTLRHALELILASNTSVAVVEDEGRFAGIVSLEEIRGGLADEAPSR